MLYLIISLQDARAGSNNLYRLHLTSAYRLSNWFEFVGGSESKHCRYQTHNCLTNIDSNYVHSIKPNYFSYKICQSQTNHRHSRESVEAKTSLLNLSNFLLLSSPISHELLPPTDNSAESNYHILIRF